ncbi:MAG: hypothetical protein K0Q71_5363, partial [Thermomicrobiales bacterium]|nr:hypothetical protein [Thermomicrobiales bacterium]
ANETSADEARLLVEVLVGLLEKADERRSPESDLPPLRIFAILTMRSEFLGVCARFKGLAEAVNRTQYLLPQMERPALMRAIREPALLYDGEVSRELAERLIGDAGGGQDQLPLIQHGLMLLWRRKAGPPSAGPPAGYGGFAEAGEPFHHDNVLSDASVPFRHATGPEEPVARPGHQGDDFIPPPSYRYEGGPAWRLDLEDYRGGSLVALLSDHADQVIAAAAPDARREKIVEHLFRALTDINAEGNAVRRPQSLARLVAVTGSDEETLRDIIGRFRADGISFLTPYGDAPIALDTLIDISHEALIRCWRKIADEKDGWLHKELRDGLIWKTLRVQAQKGETLSSAATADRDAWLRTLPSSGWSERYDGGWAEVQGLLDASRKARDAEARSRQELEEARRREAEERTRRAEEAEHAVARLAEAQQRVANEQRQRAEAERQRAAEAEERASEADAGRRRSKQMAVVAGVFGLVALCAALAAASMWWQASRAEARAQLGDSLYRAVQARNQLKDARPVTAMQLALAGLPEGTATPSARPWVGETGGALVEAMSLQRELSVLRGHEDWVLEAAFSPDGTRIVSGSDDNTVRVWDAASGAEQLVLRGHEGPVWAASFSPEGTRIVSGSEDATLRVRDAASGAEGLVLRGHEGPVWATEFSPDGARIVSGSADNTVRMWDATSGVEQLVLRGHERAIFAARFSPDGTRIVSGSDDTTLRVWDAASGAEKLVLGGHEGPVWAAGFSPDGARIVSGSLDNTVRVWDAASGVEQLVLRGHEDWLRAVGFSPDGARIVSGSDDTTLRIWDAASGAEQLVLRGHHGPVWAAEFSPDGARIVSGSFDNTVRLWKTASEAELLVLRGHEGAVLKVGFSPDGTRVVSGSSDSTARVWNAASAVEQLVLRGHEGFIWAAEFSPDGARVVSGSFDNTVRVWSAASGAEELVLRGHEGFVFAAGLSPDGTRIVSGSDDTTLRVWDAASGAEELVLRGHEGPVWAAEFSP